ncbi:hypothetical protein [Maridesulfovibrio ferrireducens]|uniref:hypothetical protein n=1 Tax=Maridesulfovibrio ferrireducens TaxID=246191 RepID=UPI001A27675C|nr:hypothetical protein [Maridesulfovibrio ferrireducens]MBI9109829.1 hypothetical protein [Maridesulfovibrio ferrireducens]
MKNYFSASKTLSISFIALSFLLIQISTAKAFSMNDLSSTAETAKTATDSAKAAADGASLLDRAKNVYSGFSDSTESLISAQTATMSLINPTQHAGAVEQISSFDSATGLTKLMEMTSYSQSLESEMDGLDLTGRLKQLLTNPASLDKAKSIYTDASGAYSSGKQSVAEAKTLYTEIKQFMAAPSSKNLSSSMLSSLGDYSDKILPFIIDNGPEQVKTAANLANVLKGFL